MTLIIALVAVICFVVGVAFLFNGFRNLPQADKIASREELDKSAEELKNTLADSAKLRSQLDSLVIQFEETKAKLSWAETNVEALKDLETQGSQTQERISQLERDLSFLSGKADSQARESIDVITRLAAENEIMQRKIEQGTGTNSAELTALQDENEKIKIQLEGYSNKVKELEAQTSAEKQTAEQLAGVEKASAQLSAENEQLKKSLEDLQAKILASQAEAEKFRNEKATELANLQARIAELESVSKAAALAPPPPSADAVQAAEEELKRVRQQNEERIVAANAAITKLNSELDALNTQITQKDERIKKMSEELAAKIDAQAVVPEPAKSADAENWSEEKKTLEKRLQELQKINQFLLNKEKVLTFKLAQSRAQASGFEKICEELKKQ